MTVGISPKTTKYDFSFISAILCVSIIALRPIYSDYGYVLFGGMCFLCFLFTSRMKFIFNRLEAWFLLLSVFLLFSILYCPDFTQGFLTWFQFTYAVLFSIAAVHICLAKCRNPSDMINVLLKTITISTVIMGVILILVEKPFGNYSQRLGSTLFRNYGTNMAYTYPLSIATVYSLYKILRKEAKAADFAISTFLVFLMFLSGTRKLIIIIFVFLFMYLFITKRKRFFQLLISFAIVLVCLLLLYRLILENEFLYRAFGRRIVQFITYFETGENSADGSTAARMQMINYAWNLFLKSPVFGNGTDSFHTLAPFGSYSHNNFTDLLCNNGIIGFLMYYLPILAVCRKLYKNINRQQEILLASDNTFFLSAIIAFLVADYFTVSYYRFPFILFYEMAAVYAQKDKSASPVSRLPAFKTNTLKAGRKDFHFD